MTITYRRAGIIFLLALFLWFVLVLMGLAARAVWSETDPADGHGWGRQFSDSVIVPNPSPTCPATCEWWCASLGRVARWSATAHPCVCDVMLTPHYDSTSPHDGAVHGRETFNNGWPNPSPTDRATCEWWCAQRGLYARWNATAQPCVCEVIR